jgi:hypothetical protein
MAAVIDVDRRTTDRKTGQTQAGRQSQVDGMIGIADGQVTLTLKSEPPKTFKAITDLNGEFYKAGLPPGTYDISVRLEWRDPDVSRTNKLVIFIATANNVVLKPGDKLQLPEMAALTEDALAAGKKPRTNTAAPRRACRMRRSPPTTSERRARPPADGCEQAVRSEEVGRGDRQMRGRRDQAGRDRSVVRPLLRARR